MFWRRRRRGTPDPGRTTRRPTEIVGVAVHRELTGAGLYEFRTDQGVLVRLHEMELTGVDRLLTGSGSSSTLPIGLGAGRECRRLSSPADRQCVVTRAVRSWCGWSASFECRGVGVVRKSVLQAGRECPVELVLELVGGKWKLVLLEQLGQGVLRFGELHRAVPTITPRMLTRQLRELEADGLVVRTVHPEVPPRVEYALSETGHSLEPVVGRMRAWGEQYRDEYLA